MNLDRESSLLRELQELYEFRLLMRIGKQRHLTLGELARFKVLARLFALRLSREIAPLTLQQHEEFVALSERSERRDEYAH